MVSINYPAYPRGVDLRSIMDATTEGYNAGRDWRDERNGVSAFGSYLDSLYGGQGAQRGPATLADLARQPAQGGVERAPLPPVADYPSQRVSQAFDVARDGPPPVGEMAAYIAQAAKQRGIDPGIALKVAKAEGLRPDTWQSTVIREGRQEPSYGPFQLLVGGGDTGFPEGLGNEFQKATGLDPSDPANWRKAVDFALDTAGKKGWGQWYGAKAAGVDTMQGIGQAMGQGATTEQPMQVADASGGIPQQQPASMLPPREDMLALFRSKTTRPLAIQLVKAAQGLSMDANDPMRQLEYRKALLELKQLQEGGAGKMGNSVVWGQDENGDWVAMQPSSAGGLVRAQTPEGVKLSPPGISNLNLGTQFGIRDRSGNIVNTVPIDNAGKASDTAQGKAQGEAASSLPGDIQAAEQTVGQIDELLSNPGLDSIVGPADQYRSGWNLGDSGRDALARLNQLKGRAFLQAYSMLKGGGQITEVEGAKAEAAMARMDRAQGESEFRKALEDFRDAVQSGVQKLREKAGQGGAQPAQSQRQRLRFNPQTGELE